MVLTGQLEHTVVSGSPSAAAAASHSSFCHTLISPFCSHVPPPAPGEMYSIGLIGEGGGGADGGGAEGGGGSDGGGEQRMVS